MPEMPMQIPPDYPNPISNARACKKKPAGLRGNSPERRTAPETRRFAPIVHRARCGPALPFRPERQVHLEGAGRGAAATTVARAHRFPSEPERSGPMRNHSGAIRIGNGSRQSRPLPPDLRRREHERHPVARPVLPGITTHIPEVVPVSVKFGCFFSSSALVGRQPESGSVTSRAGRSLRLSGRCIFGRFRFFTTLAPRVCQAVHTPPRSPLRHAAGSPGAGSATVAAVLVSCDRTTATSS